MEQTIERNPLYFWRKTHHVCNDTEELRVNFFFTLPIENLHANIVLQLNLYPSAISVIQVLLTQRASIEINRLSIGQNFKVFCQSKLIPTHWGGLNAK